MEKGKRFHGGKDDALRKKQREREMREMNMVFSKFKEDPHSDSVHVHRLMRVVQAFGRNPSKKDARERIKELEAHGKTALTLDEVLQVLDEPWTTAHNDRDSLREALQRFDDARDGHIDVEDFRAVLSTLGEPLTAKELDEVVRLGFNENSGKIDIEYLLFRLTEDNA